MLTAQQLDHFRQLLLTQSQELKALQQTGKDASATVELDQTRVGRLSRMDALQGQAMSQHRERRRENQLRKIAISLLNIENGDYGFCHECGEDIAPKRLEFDPTSTLCINCANESDNRID